MSRKILFLTIAFMTFIAQMLLWNSVLRPTSVSRVEVLRDRWDVTYNDEHFEDVKLSELRRIIGNGTKRGDKIILTREVLNLSEYNSPTILFESKFSAWKIICDGKILNDQYLHEYEDGSFIGCNLNFVALPEYRIPVKFQIELLVAEDSAYNYYENPVIGSYMDVFKYSIFCNIFVFLISSFLIIFGIVFFAISIAFRSDVPEINMQIYSSLLFIVLGVWFLAQFKLMELFFDIGGHQTEIEYISLYLIAPLMYMVMGCMQDYVHRKLFLLFAVTGTVIPFVLIFIHLIGLIHINLTLPVYQLDALGMCGYMITMLIMDKRHHRISNYQLIQLIGECALAASFVFNVIFYYFEVTGISEQIMLSKKAVPMGTMCMVFATLINYQIYIADSYARKKEHESLAHLAYADGLTGIPNRSKYEKYLSDLCETTEDYCVISIDLNGLKTVNDTQGHQMGDKYLSEFSRVLDACFRGKGFIARIGGDEFVAVLSGDDLNSAEKLIEKLNLALVSLNRKDPSIRRSAATGYAFRHEVDDMDWNAVYLLADERMYSNKNQMKKEAM